MSKGQSVDYPYAQVTDPFGVCLIGVARRHAISLVTSTAATTSPERLLGVGFRIQDQGTCGLVPPKGFSTAGWPPIAEGYLLRDDPVAP